MRTTFAGRISVFTALALGVAPMFAAQTPPDPAAPPHWTGGRAMGVEGALRSRTELQLSEQQVRQLESLRSQAVQERQARMNEMLDLQSRRRAGDVSAEAFREQMRARPEAMRSQMQRRRDQVNKVLTDAQRQRLAQLHRGMVRGSVRSGMRRPGVGRRGVGPRRFRPRWAMRSPGRWHRTPP